MRVCNCIERICIEGWNRFEKIPFVGLGPWEQKYDGTRAHGVLNQNSVLTRFAWVVKDKLEGLYTKPGLPKAPGQVKTAPTSKCGKPFPFIMCVFWTIAWFLISAHSVSPALFHCSVMFGRMGISGRCLLRGLTSSEIVSWGAMKKEFSFSFSKGLCLLFCLPCMPHPKLLHVILHPLL